MGVWVGGCGVGGWCRCHSAHFLQLVMEYCGAGSVTDLVKCEWVGQGIRLWQAQQLACISSHSNQEPLPKRGVDSVHLSRGPAGQSFSRVCSPVVPLPLLPHHTRLPPSCRASATFTRVR